jgi:hypothetical protein
VSSDPASRRDNGLVAAEWAALVDLDPRLSADLLSRLAEAGVAAYVEPVALPALDRLWVDPERADAARTVVSALHAGLDPADDPGRIRPVPDDDALRALAPPQLAPPEPGPLPLDEDALFHQIVAGYSATAEEPLTRWPAHEDLTDGRPEAWPPRRRKSDRVVPPPPPVEPVEALPGWLEPDELEPEEDDHFVPPPPPPVRWFHPRTLLALLGVVLGILAVFVPALLQLPDSNGSRILGTVLMLSGAGGLIWWMRDSFTGPDDGAIV